MKKRAAGILLYRGSGNDLEVFLAHPGGPYNAKRDDGCWTIPKGEYDDDEEPYAAARREYQEEIGQALPEGGIELTPVVLYNGKVVRAWAIEGDADPDKVVSNEVEVEWPPKSGKTISVPEVDRAEWFPLARAKQKILEGQHKLLEELERLLQDKE